MEFLKKLKIMSDEEIETKKIEFSKYMQEIYASKGINLEIIENSITEVN